MPFSSNSLTGSNGVQTYTIGFGVLDANTLTVLVDGNPYLLGADWTLNSAKTQITFSNPSFTGGETIYLERTTAIQDNQRPVDYVAGAVLTESDLDTANLHLLHLIQEAADDTQEALQISDDAVNWDAENKRIRNVAAPQVASDAARLQDVQDAAIAAGALPPVNSGNNDSHLLVKTGAWGVGTPAESRTALGLGTAAQRTVGTSTGNVVEVLAGGELPALKGTNLDLTGNPSIPDEAVLYDAPGRIVFFNTLNIEADPSGTAYPTSSTYDVPFLSSVTTGDGLLYIAVAATSVTLQPGIYKITLGFSAFCTINVGDGKTANLEGGLYIDNTGVLSSNRLSWNAPLPNNYPAAGEANVPISSFQRTVYATVNPATTRVLRVKMANTDPSGLTGEARLDNTWNPGFLLIELLKAL